MSLLIVRCPLKPFVGSVSTSQTEWQGLALADQFEWCLIDQSLEMHAPIPAQMGMGATESMPYADEALVLLPTLDVRLLEAKLPLVNAKKLQQILPNLVEDFVLAGADFIAAQVLPPLPGAPGLQRTVALIDKAWLNWLTNQLGQLLAPRVRLIPECLLLPVASEGEPGILAYQVFEGNIIFTSRSGLQLGQAWIERFRPDFNVDEIALPQKIAKSNLKEITWEWLLPAGQAYLLANQHSHAPNFALNLLPKDFRLNAKSLGKGSWASVKRILTSRASRASVNSENLVWSDLLVWRQPLNWLCYLVFSLTSLYGAYLSWMVLDDWRWFRRLELSAVQSLSPASIAALNNAKTTPSVTSVLHVFTKQVTLDQRQRGVPMDADFLSMAAKLQQLKVAFGPEVLQKIEYDGYAITFEFKSSASSISSSEVLARARSLGIAVKFLGANRYLLEPYAGLGSES